MGQGDGEYIVDMAEINTMIMSRAGVTRSLVKTTTRGQNKLNRISYIEKLVDYEKIQGNSNKKRQR